MHTGLLDLWEISKALDFKVVDLDTPKKMADIVDQLENCEWIWTQIECCC